ncbi:MAG: hypothetical protein ACKOC0_06855 [Cytophagales bacterium]
MFFLKWIKRIGLVAIVLLAGLFCFAYWGSYSEGIRSGMVVKISKKGWIFKTYEGQLNLQTFGANKSVNIVSESFEFSVEPEHPEVIKTLEEASLSGERVSLKYTERMMTFFWRGDTKYFITEVERLK